MASICPNCHTAEAIAVLENGDGISLFPCLFCTRYPRQTPHGGTRECSAPCATSHCTGWITDVYYFRTEIAEHVERHPCKACGSPKTKEPESTSPRRRQFTPDPRR
ncbi:hypothetical protein [Streptomyces celluloflavus]|uniref:hypothetical protein n=1 Tax=Streptomyces celluloflavus TaxID=58344 RepID=UPI0036B4C1FD